MNGHFITVYSDIVKDKLKAGDRAFISMEKLI
jgi:hypothetical protein